MNSFFTKKYKVIIFIIFTLFTIILIRQAQVTPLDFDSSYNLMIVKNLIKNNTYASSNYLLDNNQKFFPFDTWITTGPAVLIPSYVISLLSNNYIVPRILMITFFIIYILLLWKITNKLFALNNTKKIYNLLILFSLSFIFEINFLGIHTLGEIPGAAYLLFGCYLSKKNKYLFTGLFLSLSVLSKIQYIPFIAPYCLLLVFLNRKKLLNIIKLTIGFFVPLIIYVLAINHEIPLNKYISIYKNTLATQQVKTNLKPLYNLESFSIKINDFIRFDPIFLIISIIFIVISLNKKNRNFEFIAFDINLIYFILIWDQYNTRHIILYKFFILIFILYSIIFTKIKEKNTLFSLLFLLTALSIIYTDIKTNPQLINQKIISNIIKEKYSKSTIYFIGWWKAPDIQLLTNNDYIIYNSETRKLCSDNCLLIIDPLFKNLAPQDYKKITENINQKPSFSYLNYDLYDLDNTEIEIN